MGGGIAAPESQSTRKKGKKKKRKRLGFTLDMTPMVDVAFLLLTFFMLTTTFAKPNTMEVNLPSKDMSEVKVAELNVLTIRVTEGDKAYWNIGFDEPKPFELYDKSGEKPTISNEFRNILKTESEKIRQRVGEDVMAIVLKFDKKAQYRNLVDVLDELNILQYRRFSIADYTEQDAAEIEKVSGTQAGAAPANQP
ncbi:MAG: biopolymer transporter ExbD [Chloroherpetonaceae bacterium]|nr:biopolymer transporter ExbD [Chloroherpetonaceae bacterium]